MKTETNLLQEIFLKNEILNPDLSVNEETIKAIFKKAKLGLKQYIQIQQWIGLTNAEKDSLFQEVFSYFYKIDPHRNKEWKEEYYGLLESAKENKIDFGVALKTLFEKTGKMEASFASKIVATVDPTLPVIDKWVLINLSLDSEYKDISKLKDSSERINKTIELYQKLIDGFNQFLSTDGGRNVVAYFNGEYPYAKITEAKILDLILWQLKR